jgi:hypothetical protein
VRNAPGFAVKPLPSANCRASAGRPAEIASQVALVVNVIGVADAAGAVSNTEFMLLSVFNRTEGNQTGQAKPDVAGLSGFLQRLAAPSQREPRAPNPANPRESFSMHRMERHVKPRPRRLFVMVRRRWSRYNFCKFTRVCTGQGRNIDAPKPDQLRDILTRGLSAIALFAVCGFGVIGTSAVVMGASSMAALAHGGHGGGAGGHGGGGRFHGGGFRGGGFGFGFWGPEYDYPYGYVGYDDDGPNCYLVRRRVMTRQGWRLRRAQVCG